LLQQYIIHANYTISIYTPICLVVALIFQFFLETPLVYPKFWTRQLVWEWGWQPVFCEKISANQGIFLFLLRVCPAAKKRCPGLGNQWFCLFTVRVCPGEYQGEV